MEPKLQTMLEATGRDRDLTVGERHRLVEIAYDTRHPEVREHALKLLQEAPAAIVLKFKGDETSAQRLKAAFERSGFAVTDAQPPSSPPAASSACLVCGRLDVAERGAVCVRASCPVRMFDQDGDA